VVRRMGNQITMIADRDVWWEAALDAAEPLQQARPMDAEAPCLLLYTSGSTGRPKGCLHTHSGLPFKFAQEAHHGLGVEVGDRVCWLTDMGWVMGTWLTTAALTNGATAVMFEGVPDYPDPDRLWAVAERARVTVLGIAPTVVRAIMAHGDQWTQAHPMPDLRAIGSTGEPWNLGPWWWCHEQVGKGRVPIINMSGGTECGASIVCNAVFLPIKPMGFSAATLGMAADVVDNQGKSVVGAVGELVVRQAWPGMTKGLWDGNERYLQTYWSTYDDCWLQGDFATKDEDGFFFLHGRSDDTIMLAGKRVGPAEIESLLVSDEAVIEAAAVGVPHEVKASLDAVSARLSDSIVRAEGKTVKPYAIHRVPALPKTRNGKVMRRIAKAAYLGNDIGDVTALENPESLAAFATLAPEELR
jgi:acetyl-CoA synthetase